MAYHGEDAQQQVCCMEVCVVSRFVVRGFDASLLVTWCCRCHKEMAGRAFCPAMWPCVPSEACTGNNTCARGYDDSSERCAQYVLHCLCCDCCLRLLLLVLLVFVCGDD